MNIALSYWQDRIAPVFDVADFMLLVEMDNGREVARRRIALHQQGPFLRSEELIAHGVDVLICGAVSDSLGQRLRLSGIRVLDFVCGPVGEVLNAFLSGILGNNRLAKSFAMPGCHGRRNRIRSRQRARLSRN